MTWPARATIVDADGAPKLHRFYLFGTGKTFGVFLHHFVGGDEPSTLSQGPAVVGL